MRFEKIYLSENKSTATETMMQGSSIYLLGMSSHVFNFIFKTSQYLQNESPN